MSCDTIVVVDFGSQYNHLIVRRLRELGVYSELISHKSDIAVYVNNNIKGIILSGGPKSVREQNRWELAHEVWNLDIPILGICYGMQLMMSVYGGNVEAAQASEYGSACLHVIQHEDPLLRGVSDGIMWMSHQDETRSIPSQWDTIASTDNCKYAAVSMQEKQRWGIQFHPEVSHSEQGTQVLKNFISLCNVKQEWSMQQYLIALKEEVKTKVGDQKVICGLSGGVDSSVTAALLQQCIGDNLYCIYVDHGLMRKGETEEVAKVFKPLLGERFLQVDAQERFFSQLQGVLDPEKKRKIIGREFIYTFDKVASSIEGATMLAQGTLYTDMVESGKGGSSHTIKSHHNVGGLPKDMKFTLVEPLNKLFKDEVRALGKELGLSDAIVNRQPFPGPGIGIRVLGEVTFEKAELVRETDFILREEIKKASLEDAIWQYFTMLPSIKTVGVRGDQRSYCDAIVIRAVCSVDGMTASVAGIPFAVLQTISNRITNEVHGINRVLYDITEKPPGTIEFE